MIENNRTYSTESMMPNLIKILLIEYLERQHSYPFLTLEGRDVVRLHPVKVVVQPWRGRHQVYGVFLLPKGYSVQYPIVLDIRDIGRYSKMQGAVQVNPEDDLRKPGYYCLRIYLRTRVALRALLRGQLHHLSQPQNWTLTYTKNCFVREIRWFSTKELKCGIYF